MIKKALSCIISICLVMTTIVTIGVSASFNSNKDPNGDGTLNFLDAYYILLYLYGSHEPSDLSQLDVDDNDVVSDVDYTYVQMYDAGLVNNFSSANIENRSNITRYYYVYNAQTGAYLRSYSLSVPEDDNSGSKGFSDIDKKEGDRGIIGVTDDRIIDWSNRGTAKIISECDAGYLGSGFVVDSHTIATAAHVVFDTKYNTTKCLDEILLFDADHTQHSFTPVEYHVPISFINSADYTVIDDYALITVEEDVSNYNSFHLGSVTDTADTNNLQIVTVGFPQYIYTYLPYSNTYSSTQINTGLLHDERLSTGSITYMTNDTIMHTADASGGNSGGPIYAVEFLNGITYHTVIGIHVAEPNIDSLNVPYNCGVRFDASTLKFYRSNGNLQY